METNPDEVHKMDSEKRSVLHLAAYCGEPDIVEMLIEEGGARVNIKDSKWLTPLHR